MAGKGTAKHRKEKRVIESLDNDTVLDQLLDLAGQLGITVRQEVGEFRGGSCRLANNHLLILQKTDTDVAKIDILARELATMPWSDIQIDSALQHYLNQRKEKYNGAL
ncbi:hypothetical protein JW998_03515 [candidate division KSB1 bacterium]|nr:hypothetical protein [candidate division KSB1 bacterium]